MISTHPKTDLYLANVLAQLSRQPRPIYRTLATQVPVPPAAQQASSSASTLQEGSESVAPIFEEGDVDVTDSVLKMLESEGGRWHTIEGFVKESNLRLIWIFRLTFERGLFTHLIPTSIIVEVRQPSLTKF